jgi:hypothetical protein
MWFDNIMRWFFFNIDKVVYNFIGYLYDILITGFCKEFSIIMRIRIDSGNRQAMQIKALLSAQSIDYG